MLLSHSTWLCIILPTLIAAEPHQTGPASPKRSLPPKLQEQVPACAQPCLETSLSERFPFACTTPADLSCLCSRYSFDGSTLGEVALRCIYASCSTYNGATSAYNVCLGQRYAVMPTLTALTVVDIPSSTPKSKTSSRPVATTITHPSLTTTSTPRSQTSPIDTVIVDSVSLVPSATSTTPRGTTTPLPAVDSPSTMSPAQIAGLAVAVGAAFIIAIGIMGLVIFLRRRREGKNNAEANEKNGFSPGPSDYHSPWSQYTPSLGASETPNQFLLSLPPVQRRHFPGIRSQDSRNLGHVPSDPNIGRNVNTPPREPDVALNSVHPLLRFNQGVSNNSSNSSVPLEQIGLAITVEPPRPPMKRNEQQFKPLEGEEKKKRPTIARRSADVSQRPDSVMTTTTLFEEDDVRRESKLLPPIPPIRTFKPSWPMPAANLTRPPMEKTAIRQVPQQPELFLDIPVRYSRSQPSKFNAPDIVLKGNLAMNPAPNKPPNFRSQPSEHNPKSAGSELSNVGDIPAYYFTAYQELRPIHSISSSNSNQRLQSKQEQGFGSVKLKRSSSNVSRAISRASANIRDSYSSQTSFETVDPDDPTPENDDADKRLTNGKFSSVAESPIHKLRYPKVPRTSNQLVPRSPKSPQSQTSQNSPRWQAQPSPLYARRKGDQRPPKLGSLFRTGSPDTRTTSEIRRYRHHLRSSSVETFMPNPARSSDRSTRTKSSLWPKSPAIFYPEHAVRPLTIRKSQQQPLHTPIEEMQALKSPVWVPRLTPTRQGDDLFINVTYSKPGR